MRKYLATQGQSASCDHEGCVAYSGAYPQGEPVEDILTAMGWVTAGGRDFCPRHAAPPSINFVSAAREFLAHADAATGERLHVVVHRDAVEVRLEDGHEVMASAGGPVPNNVLAALRLRLADIASARAQKQRETLATTEAALAALKGEAK